MKDKQQGKPVSPRKLAANRANAQRSTGPRTSAGKQQSSQNSYQHGFYGTRLYPNNELIARDGADYKRIYAAYWTHYSPVGDLEKYCVERIAVESLRLARLLGYEQKVLAWTVPFEQRSIDRIVRYETSINRQLEKAIERLERLQEARLADSNQFKSADGKSDDAPSNPDEATEATQEVPEDLIRQLSQRIGTSSTAPQQAEGSVKKDLAPTEGKPSNKQAEGAVDIGDTEPKPQVLAKMVEQAMNLSAEGKPKSALGTGENYKTGLSG